MLPKEHKKTAVMPKQIPVSPPWPASKDRISGRKIRIMPAIPIRPPAIIFHSMRAFKNKAPLIMLINTREENSTAINPEVRVSSARYISQ